MNRHNDKSIKNVLQEYILSNENISKGYHTTKIDEVWRKVMGATISKYTRKVYFSDVTVKIYLDSAPLKKELIMGKAKVISLLNEELGNEVVKELEIF
jgi:hypothetical protein